MLLAQFNYKPAFDSLTSFGSVSGFSDQNGRELNR